MTYTYDALGRTASVADGSATVEYAYDAEGRQTQVQTATGGHTDKVNYEYNALGQLTRTYTGDTVSLTGSTTGDGKAMTDTRYAYDQLGRLIQVTLVERNDTPLTTPEVTKYYFDAAGDLSVVAHSNGMTDHYTYDGLNRLTLLTHNNTANAVISSFGYALNADGSKWKEFDNGETSPTYTWMYDGLGRLTQEAYANSGDASANYTDTYTFDTLGNRTGKAHVTAAGTTTTGYTYDANDRLLQETFNAPGTSDDTTTVYSYNGTNNNFTMLTGKAVHAGLTTSGTTLSTTTYSYDDQDRLTQITAGNVTTSFAYDPAGARISQTVVDSGTSTTTTIKYVTDTNNPTGYTQVLEERTTVGSTTTTKTYTLGLDVIAQSDTATSNGTLTFLYDGHGSTRAMVGIVSSALALLQTYAYDAYGNRISASNLTSLATAALTSLLYSGEQTDGSGLQFLRARYYGPNVGRFIKSDFYTGNNFDPLSLHKYLYVKGNPIAGVDPSGQFTSLEGLSAQAQITRIYRQDHLGATITSAGKWFFGVFPDIQNWSKSRWLEVKPLTPTGISDAVDALFKYIPLGLIEGWFPDKDWVPRINTIIIRGKPEGFVNVGGIVFYGDQVQFREEVIAGFLILNAKTLADFLPYVFNTVKRGIRAVTAERELRPEAETSIATLLGVLGVPI